MPLASVTGLIEGHSGWALALLLLLLVLEPFALLLPGEAALIACAGLASEGALWLVPVITVAAAAAITGDSVGVVRRPLAGVEVPYPIGGAATQRDDVQATDPGVALVRRGR